MSDTKHTPGPWVAYDWRVVDTQGKDGMCTAVICDTANNKKTRTPKNRANARLIATAPELLEALENCVNQIKALCSADDVPDGANAAIKKAKGEL